MAADVAKIVPARLRLDRSCQIIISSAHDIEEKIGELLRDSNLSSVVIPFSYEEFMSDKMSPPSILNRFRKYLFDADLFTTSRPIENDVFFFGRRDYALDIATKCKNSSYLCGVFGLRRSGKTSMLFAVKRQLESAGCPVVFIPCQEKLDILSAMAAHPSVSENQKRIATSLSYKDLFDTTVNHACYFLVLVLAIEQNYDTVFSAIFDEGKNTVVNKLKDRFNRYRQIPAHPIDEDAKNWSNEDFEQFRKDMNWLEKILTDNE